MIGRLRAAALRLSELVARSSRERELSAELESHLALHIDDNIRAGMSAEAARRDALVKLGGIEATKERYRDRRGFMLLEAVRQDVTYAVRVLRRNPGFSTVAVLTLALGIGSNSAIFSVVNAVLFRPLPFPDPSRLVMVWATSNTTLADVASYPDFEEWRDQSTSFDDLGAFAVRTVLLSGVADAELVEAGQVTPGFFEVLGVPPAMGRSFRPDENDGGTELVAVVGDGFWKRYFGGRPDILGQSIEIDDRIHTVVGVMPQGFRVAPEVNEELYTPLVPEPSRNRGFLRVVGRLKAGTSIERARVEMAAITERLALLYSKTNTTVRANVQPLVDAMVGPARTGLLLLFGVVGLVLLIACANVANLMFARSLARQRELTVRAALGAGRGRLVRQLLTEHFVIAGAGGLLGLLFAHWTSGAIALLLAESFQIPRIENTSTDSAVLGFTLGISIATAVLFGLVPALSLSSGRLGEQLQESGRSATHSVRTRRLRNSLVIVETALAVVLLGGAGVLLKTLVTMQGTPPGFQRENLLVSHLWLPQTRLQTLDERVPFYDELLTRVRGLAGVQSAALVTDLPMGGQSNRLRFRIVGRPDPAPGPLFGAGFNMATSAYFQTMGIPILQGREFSDGDRAGTPRVIVINQTAARQFWPGESPIGQQIELPGPGQSSTMFNIVGVTGDVLHSGLASPPRAEIFINSMQSPLGWSNLALVVRTEGNPVALAPSVRAIARSVNPNVPVQRIRTMEEVLSASMATPRVYTQLLAGFAALALTLAAIGLYGLVSYTVSQRMHEMGIRVALGASRGEIVRLILREGLVLAISGLVVGLAGAAALTRVLESLTSGIQPDDPAPFALVTALLLVAAVGASYIPARRAARVDPITALRTE